MVIKAHIKSFSYPSKQVLKDIDLEVKKGEFIVLTGLSGCGKTSLLRVLNGLFENFYDGEIEGEVEILDKNIRDYKKGELAKYISTVFQNPKDQFFSSVAEDEVALVLENLGLEREKQKIAVNEAFAKMKTFYLREKTVFEMSGGQRQKIAITSSLAYKADIVFFDEPSASLDYMAIEDLKEALDSLKKEGKTIIIAEHRLYFLKDLADRFIIMRDGKIVKELDKDQITEEDRKIYDLRCFDERKLKKEDSTELGEKVLEIKNLDVKIKNKVLIKNLDLDLKLGECMAILGKNGIGKTSLAKEIAGLYPINKESRGLKNSKKGRLKETSYLLQDASAQIFAHTVEREVVDRRRQEDKEHIQKAKHYLKSLDLLDKKLNHPQELSVGEIQRLGLITSLLKDSKIIILDEPTAGLDFKRMELVAKIIKEEKKKRPIILITHDLELLFKCADTVLCLGEKENKKIEVKENEETIKEFIKGIG